MPYSSSPRTMGLTARSALVAAEPIHDAGVGCGLGRLAQDIGVHHVLHSESVDSEGTGWNQPFTGHASRPVHQSAIVRCGPALEQVLSSIEPFNIEFLAGSDAIALAEGGRNNDLTLG